jgi:hypothetical protein
MPTVEPQGPSHGSEPNDPKGCISPDGEALPPTERQAFERWAVSTHGKYTLSDHDAGSMWSAWQARAALAGDTSPAACITAERLADAFLCGLAWMRGNPETSPREWREAANQWAAPAGVPQDSAPLIPSGEQP